MDPVGTIPLFLSTLKTVDPARRRLVLLREIGFAYVVLLACLFVGTKHCSCSASKTFAFVTGWRINSEVLPLQWRQVDVNAGEVRLDPGTTKNLEGRVFYLTSELKDVLKPQRKTADRIGGYRLNGRTPATIFWGAIAA